MKRFKILKILFVVLVNIFTRINSVASDCQGWKLFKAEKCYKIFSEVQPRDFDGSIKVCRERNSSLLIIESQEEQAFLSKFIFENNTIWDNVWIGLKRNKLNGEFEWLDNSPLKYTNWERGNPTNKTGRDCVQMLANDDGTWSNFDCRKKDFVVCQKKPTITIDELQKMVVKMQNQLKEYENKQFKMENLFNKSIKEIQTANSKTSDELNRVKKELIQIKNIQNNSVPIGFIYVQLPKQSEPKTLFPNTEWSDVSQEYAGLFFRTVGDSSGQFGQVQDDASPRIVEIENNTDEGYEYKRIKLLTRNANDKNFLSKTLYTGTYWWLLQNESKDYFLKFNISLTEVRPKNTAVKIWKRVK